MREHRWANILALREQRVCRRPRDEPRVALAVPGVLALAALVTHVLGSGWAIVPAVTAGMVLAMILVCEGVG